MAKRYVGADAAPPRGIRFVLSETAVRRLRAAESLVGELREKLHREAPAWLTCDVAEAWLALVEACNEIDKCNVESATEVSQ